MDNLAHSPREHSVLSTSTILILSGFLLGVSVAQPLGDISFYVFTCGLTGLVAYLAFEVTGIRNERDTIRRDQKLMEVRLLRHVGLGISHSCQDHQEKDRLLDWLKRETESLSH